MAIEEIEFAVNIGEWNEAVVWTIASGDEVTSFAGENARERAEAFAEEQYSIDEVEWKLALDNEEVVDEE